MAFYTFRFSFPDMDEARKYCEVKTYGGNLGTALARAWRAVKNRREYKGIPKFQPQAIEIAPRETTKRNLPYRGGWVTEVKVGQ